VQHSGHPYVRLPGRPAGPQLRRGQRFQGLSDRRLGHRASASAGALQHTHLWPGMDGPQRMSRDAKEHGDEADISATYLTSAPKARRVEALPSRHPFLPGQPGKCRTANQGGVFGMEPPADFVQRLLIRGAQCHADLLPQSRWVTAPARLIRNGFGEASSSCWSPASEGSGGTATGVLARRSAGNPRPPGKPGRCSAGSPRGANKRTHGG
jgi:hypothetical protein